MNRTLRIASFNIRYDSKGIDPLPLTTARGFMINEKLEKRQKKEQPWNVRRYKVADTILFHRFDMVGIQEAVYSQIKDLESLLTKDGDEWGWIGVGRVDGKPDGDEGGEFTPIFYNKNRLKLLDFEHFWLSETPNVPNSIGWDAKLPRVATQARFQDLQTDVTFYNINTHFDHLGVEARSKSAKLLIDYANNLRKSSLSSSSSTTITEKSSIVFLTADFNCEESDEPYNIITGGKYRNVESGDDAIKKKSEKKVFVDSRYEIYGGKDESYGHYDTFTGFDVDNENCRIDYILVNQQALIDNDNEPRIKIVNHGVMENKYDDDLYISDHRPVISDIRFI